MLDIEDVFSMKELSYCLHNILVTKPKLLSLLPILWWGDPKIYIMEIQDMEVYDYTFKIS